MGMPMLIYIQYACDIPRISRIHIHVMLRNVTRGNSDYGDIIKNNNNIYYKNIYVRMHVCIEL